MAADDAFIDRSMSEEDQLFFMANLHPRDTGLAMTVWASPKGDARHDVSLKISAVPGGRLQLQDGPVMAVRPKPRLLHGRMSPQDEQAVAAWIVLNEAVLVDYWEDRATTFDLVRRLQRLPG